MTQNPKKNLKRNFLIFLASPLSQLGHTHLHGKTSGGSDKKLYKNRKTDGGYLIGSRQFEISTYLRGGGGSFQNWFCREDWVGKIA